MQESQRILDWIDRGKQIGVVEARRADLLKVLRARFPDPVPGTVRWAIELTKDSRTLERWFDTALTAQTLAEFTATIGRYYSGRKAPHGSPPRSGGLP